MTSTDITVRGAAGELAIPNGARQLGARVKPIIRLGMGIKDPERGFPRKTDYLTVRGDERAVAKFKSVYGDQPKRVKIMVPSSLALALDISYRSFIGGGSDDGGRPLALGFTNFATLGYVGGPDMLRVWRQDGTYAEVQTEGLDETGQPLDDIARDLNIEVHATFTFTIPEVLGWGSFAQVTSKGKKSADNLAFKLSEIYSAFGAKAPWAFDRDEPPLLVLKPDTAMTRFEDKDTHEARWGKTKIFVLDIVIPEAFHDMQDRLLDHQRELAPDGAAAALYGGERRRDELPVIESAASGAGDVATQGGPSAPPQAASSAPDTDDEAEPSLAEEAGYNSPEGVADDEIVVAAERASQYHPPNGKYTHLSLTEILADPEGESWLRYALRVGDTKVQPEKAAEYRQAVWAFARVYAPDLYHAVLAEKEAQGQT